MATKNHSKLQTELLISISLYVVFCSLHQKQTPLNYFERYIYIRGNCYGCYCIFVSVNFHLSGLCVTYKLKAKSTRFKNEINESFYRASAHRRAILIQQLCLSVRVRPSVRNIPELDENGLTYCHSLFIIRQHNHSSFISIKRLHEIPTGSLLRGR